MFIFIIAQLAVTNIYVMEYGARSLYAKSVAAVDGVEMHQEKHTHTGT